jgi:hypothetical protein
VSALLPTPVVTNRAGMEPSPASARGTRGTDLGPAIGALLPTPNTMDGLSPRSAGKVAKRCRGNGAGGGPPRNLRETVVNELLPTPAAAGSNGKSARAMTASVRNGRRSGGGQSSPPGLEEIAALASGRRPAHLPPDEQLSPAGRAALGALGALLPTPQATDGNGGPRAVPARRTHRGPDHGPRLRDMVPALLPTPAARDSGNTPEQHLAKKPGRTQVTSLQVIAEYGLIETGGRLPGDIAGAEPAMLDTGWLPEHPAESRPAGEITSPAESSPGPQDDGAREGVPGWGPYAPAVERWEQVLGRAAPSPTEPGKNGLRLSPRFVEWMQGLDSGWVTDVPGLSRSQQLKALGNGCVPHQVALALELLLGDITDAGEPAA